jgi:hypothetical protein
LLQTRDFREEEQEKRTPGRKADGT